MVTLRTQLPLRTALGEIRDADVLLWRPRTVVESLTAIAGRGAYCHAAMAAWWGDELMCLQSRFRGIEAVTLASQVAQHPGLIDVYTAEAADRCQALSRLGAVAAMKRKTGRRYGLHNLLRTALTHTLLLRLWLRADTCDDGDDDHNRPEFCSQAVASALRLGGGIDPVPQLRDRFTEPDDLARSALYRYRFTLLP